MFNDKIVRPLSNNERCVYQTNAPGKGGRQAWFLVRTRLGRLRHCWIQHDLSAAQLKGLKEMRNSMPREPEQAVVDIQRIDIDRFDRGRPGGDRVKILYRQIAERISFEAKIH